MRLRFVGIQYNDTVTYFCIPAEPLSLSPSSALFLYLGLRELVDVSTKTRSLLQYIHGSFDDDGVPFTSTVPLFVLLLLLEVLSCIVSSKHHASMHAFLNSNTFFDRESSSNFTRMYWSQNRYHELSNEKQDTTLSLLSLLRNIPTTQKNTGQNLHSPPTPTSSIHPFWILL